MKDNNQKPSTILNLMTLVVAIDAVSHVEKAPDDARATRHVQDLER